MTRLAIVADAETAALHGLDGAFAWGEARTLAPGDALTGFDVVVALEDVPAPSEAIRWRATGHGGPGRVIAAAGEGLWRRAPWPVRDTVFALSPGAGILVAGDGDGIVKDLRDRDAPVRAAARLTVAELQRAAVVVLADSLAAGAFAVLAAGRLLIAPRATPTFGLLAGVDHLAYDSDREAAAYADAAATFPDAFEPVAAMAALTAETQRASAVYGRLATEW